MGIVGGDADIEIVVVVQDTQLGSFVRQLTRSRDPLDEIGHRHGLFPCRLVQPAVERDLVGDADRCNDAFQALGFEVGLSNTHFRRAVPGRSLRVS